jgi:hypothetical protein
MERLLNRRTVLITLFFVCLISVVGILLYWHSENLVEEKLQDYITQLKDDGFTIEERHLTDLYVDGVLPIRFFGDFRSFAKQEAISQIYLDREIRALFFLHSMGNEVEANVFYYS